MVLSIRDVLLSLAATLQTEHGEGQEGGINAETLRDLSQVFGDIDPSHIAFSEKRMLWLDPHPDNNRDLINSFQALGVRIHFSATNAEAVREVQDGGYSLIITNMARPLEPAIGYMPNHCLHTGDEEKDPTNANYSGGIQFLEFICVTGNKIPLIVYTYIWGRSHAGKENEFHVSLIARDTAAVYTRALRVLAEGK